VLPLVPILAASALAARRLGVIALAVGLGVSFSAIGIFLATIGASLSLSNDLFRHAAAVLMILFGLAMLSQRLAARFSHATSLLSGPGQKWLSKISGETLLGQFAIGLVLGAIWTPCVGPTLGAATTLAAQGRHLGDIALLMGVFGTGAALPLAVLGSLSRASTLRVRARLGSVGMVAKTVLGGLFVGFGLLAFFGLDKVLEAAILSASPAWLTALTTWL
jgi:cytochrome c biogenesis protein CcdA